MTHRYLVFLIAGALPLLLTGLIAPSMAHQLDFWLLWLGAMFVGLPVLFAEVALSARSADAPWHGMQKLTREADAGVIWRIFAVLSVLISLLIAGSVSSRIAFALTDGHLAEFGKSVQIPSIGLSAGVMVVVLILSLLKSRLLPVGLLLLVAGAVIALLGGVTIPAMSEVSLGEWAKAVVLALLCVGVGSGLYWFGTVGISNQSMQLKKSLSGLILPIWLTQLAFGALALLVSSSLIDAWSFVVSGLGMLLVAAFLLYYAGSQLIARLGVLVGGGLTVILAMLASLLPTAVMSQLIAVVALLAVLLLAIFAGFVMKISHLRKTFNFASELRYNIWRVLVRIIVPVAVLMALVGLVLEWL